MPALGPTVNSSWRVTKPRLHLDADTSIRQLQRALIERGHDVTRTPNDWISAEADDEAQLLGATAQGRVIFTFNVRDFAVLARYHPAHGGLILAVQSHWTLAGLIAALERALATTEADGLVIEVRDLTPAFPDFDAAVRGEHGRGLWGARRLGATITWFQHHAASGKTVRAELPYRPAEP